MFRTPSPGDSISVALRKLLQGGRRGSQATYKFATKRAGSLNIKDQVSRHLAFSVWEDTSLWTQNSFLSYAPQLSGANLFAWSPCCFAFSQLLSNLPGGVLASTGPQFGSPHYIWRPAVTDGCGSSCLLIRQETLSFHTVMKLLRTCSLFLFYFFVTCSSDKTEIIFVLFPLIPNKYPCG